MSELISGKDVLVALGSGKSVQYKYNEPHKSEWLDLQTFGWGLNDFLAEDSSGKYLFRLKPRTVNLNGVDVGLLYSSQWDKQNPNKVTIEFNTEEEARHFNNNALKIFNGV